MLRTKQTLHKTLRSDHGKEYTSRRFDMSCKNERVKHQLITEYTLK